MKRANRRSPVAGFTLIEAIAATLLMAAILAALATITAQWLPNWNRGITRLQRVELFATGLERLVSDLASAEYVSADGATLAPLFEGSELSVTFVRTAFGPNAGNGLEVVRIAENGTDQGPAMIRTTAPFMPGAVDNAQSGSQLPFANPVPVIRSPYRVVFSYAGRDRIWRDTWHNRPELPHAIRVRVRDAATQQTLAVSTATLVNAEVPARCVAPRSAAECPMINAAALAASSAAATTDAAATAPARPPGP